MKKDNKPYLTYKLIHKAEFTLVDVPIWHRQFGSFKWIFMFTHRKQAVLIWLTFVESLKGIARNLKIFTPN